MSVQDSYDMGYDHAILGIERLSRTELECKDVIVFWYDYGYQDALNEVEYYFKYESIFGD